MSGGERSRDDNASASAVLGMPVNLNPPPALICSCDWLCERSHLQSACPFQRTFSNAKYISVVGAEGNGEMLKNDDFVLNADAMKPIRVIQLRELSTSAKLNKWLKMSFFFQRILYIEHVLEGGCKSWRRSGVRSGRHVLKNAWRRLAWNTDLYPVAIHFWNGGSQSPLLCRDRLTDALSGGGNYRANDSQFVMSLLIVDCHPDNSIPPPPIFEEKIKINKQIPFYPAQMQVRREPTLESNMFLLTARSRSMRRRVHKCCAIVF